MLNGKFKGKDIGSGRATWQLSEGMKAGTVSREDF
jgi:dihydroxy-acid dehydratase